MRLRVHRGTLADDGDPLDVLVIIAEPTFPGCVVRARPVGVLDMVDEKGHDYKILAVAHDDPRWESTNRLEDLSPHRLLEIENFFQTYKSSRTRPTDVSGWLGVDDAWRIIEAAGRRWPRVRVGARDVSAERARATTGSRQFGSASVDGPMQERGHLARVTLPSRAISASPHIRSVMPASAIC